MDRIRPCLHPEHCVHARGIHSICGPVMTKVNADTRRATLPRDEEPKAANRVALEPTSVLKPPLFQAVDPDLAMWGDIYRDRRGNMALLDTRASES